LVRQAIWLWWHDFSANDLGDVRNGHAVPIAAAASVNDLGYKSIAPGDLAVTADGRHVMAYLGDRLWIEADPIVGRVVIIEAPCRTNPWFEQKIAIVLLRGLGG
jgi:hypothetical protein